MNKIKYEIEITFNSGQKSVHYATEMRFHPGKGGIDIYDAVRAIPFFPGREEEVDKIEVRLVRE